MKFYTEINGDIWGFDSWGDFFETYFSILLGRIVAWIIYLGVIGFILYKFHAWLWS
jgi:hypothetical protein